MSRHILPPIGVLLLAVGFVWFFHGVGLLEDGIMSDQPLWAVLGAGMIAAGIGVLGRARASSRG
jgi:hypothetical protein